MRNARSRNNTVFFSLLSLMTALNASQPTVWCVGHDGHVAVEPLAHMHHGAADDGESHCCPCTDIPIPVSVCTARPRPTAPETKLEGLTVLLSLPASPAAGLAWTTAFASPVGPPDRVLLRGIVLQV